jgi:PIN domain nuclease of toxin-antitoxin system
MRLLLDTHIWLWSFREPHKLSSEVHRVLANSSNRLFLSPISLWEVVIQLEKKRLKIKEDFALWFARACQELDLEEAPLTWKALHELRFVLPNHKDPADRFLVATAIANNLVLVTADETLIGVPGLKVLANT